VERVYWHQWPAWIARELKQFGEQAWTLPLTATVEERLLAAAGGQTLCHHAGRIVGIFSPRRDAAELLIDACRHFGLQAIALDASPHRISGLSLAIWDGDQCEPSEAQQLKRLASAIHPASLVVLLTCPRLEERNRALAAGASAVFSKPLLLEELFAFFASIA
jgi:hypothetical protein